LLHVYTIIQTAQTGKGMLCGALRVPQMCTSKQLYATKFALSSKPKISHIRFFEKSGKFLEILSLYPSLQASHAEKGGFSEANAFRHLFRGWCLEDRVQGLPAWGGREQGRKPQVLAHLSKVCP